MKTLIFILLMAVATGLFANGGTPATPASGNTTETIPAVSTTPLPDKSAPAVSDLPPVRTEKVPETDIGDDLEHDNQKKSDKSDIWEIFDWLIFWDD